MKRRINSNYFENVNSVIDGLSRRLGLEKGLKVSTIAGLWPKVVGPRFEKTSKIYSVYRSKNHDAALIAVNSSSVAQELGFYKNDILKKLHKIGENFGFDIKEISFSAKYWKSEEKQGQQEVKMPAEVDLEAITIPDELLNSIRISLDEKSGFDDEMRERFLQTIIKDLKTRLWMKQNNYPTCPKCSIPMSIRHSEQENLCPSCKYKD